MNRDRSAARRLVLRRLLQKRKVAGQEELVDLLRKAGHEVTQATVSRDLTAIGAKKMSSPGGKARYHLGDLEPGAGTGELGRRMKEFAREIERSLNLIVVKTSPGSASPVASAVDSSPPSGVLGTVAGDDTVLIITRSARAGAEVHRCLESLLES